MLARREGAKSYTDLADMMKAVANAASANGFNVNQLVKESCGVGGCGGNCAGAGAPGGVGIPVLAATGGHGSPLPFIPWAPKAGACPDDVGRWLCWLFKSYCSYNRFGAIGNTKLLTNAVTLPDAETNFDLGPDQLEELMGAPFPVEWKGEAVYHGISRIKVSFNITDIVGGAGTLTFDQIETGLFNNLDFRILQSGTDDQYTVALDMGDAQDAQSSAFVPSQGGFYLPCGTEFVPFGIAPELQSFDFRGTAPGSVGTDEYTLSATVSVFFAKVC